MKVSMYGGFFPRRLFGPQNFCSLAANRFQLQLDFAVSKTNWIEFHLSDFKHRWTLFHQTQLNTYNEFNSTSWLLFTVKYNHFFSSIDQPDNQTARFDSWKPRSDDQFIVKKIYILHVHRRFEDRKCVPFLFFSFLSFRTINQSYYIFFFSVTMPAFDPKRY